MEYLLDELSRGGHDHQHRVAAFVGSGLVCSVDNARKLRRKNVNIKIKTRSSYTERTYQVTERLSRTGHGDGDQVPSLKSYRPSLGLDGSWNVETFLAEFVQDRIRKSGLVEGHYWMRDVFSVNECDFVPFSEGVDIVQRMGVVTGRLQRQTVSSKPKT